VAGAEYTSVPVMHRHPNSCRAAATLRHKRLRACQAEPPSRYHSHMLFFETNAEAFATPCPVLIYFAMK